MTRVHAVIDELFDSSVSRDSFRRSAISKEEGTFLERLAAKSGITRTIEVGCANAVSSLYICAGLTGKAGASHIAIDPFQRTDFQMRGVDNVRRAGVDFFRLIEEPSEIALPDLLKSGAAFDMAFIDGLHTLDQTMLDFYYLDRMLTVGGIVVLDDMNHRAVNRVAHYVVKYPNYEFIGNCGTCGSRRRALNVLKRVISTAAWPARKLLSEVALRELVDDSILHADLLNRIDNCTMAAFRKTGIFKRDTDWYHGI